MGALKRWVKRLDAFQQRHALLGFPIAVLQKYGNDRASAFATRIAYQGLFSVFPLLLLLATIAGFVLEDHPDLRRDLLDSAVADFPIVGSQLRATAEPIDGSGIGLLVGIAGTLYGGLGVGQAAMAGMNTVWNIPRVSWPNFVLRRVRSIAIVGVFGLAVLASNALSAISGALVVGIAQAAALLGTFALDTALFLVAFRVLTAEPLSWRDVRVGAVLAAALWGALKLVGSWYVDHVLRTADDVYGFFAVVIALLTWMYMAAQLTLLAAEIDVVRRHRLWPRSLTQPPLTAADRAVFERLAHTTVRRPEYRVEVHFDTSTDSSDGRDDSATRQRRPRSRPR